jgi:hypothetical protein
MTYDDLTKFDDLDENKKTTDEYVSEIKNVLKQFMFEDLSKSDGSNDAEKKKMRHSIINFLFSGKFALKFENGLYYYSEETQRFLKSNLVANFDLEIDILRDELSIYESNNDKKKIVKTKSQIKNLQSQKEDYEKNLKRYKELESNENKTDDEKEEYNTLNKQLEKVDPDEFYNRMLQSWKHVSEEYNDYLDLLKHKLQVSNSKLNKVIVYEAPPYISNMEPHEKYFFTSASKKYSEPIRKCFDPNDVHKAFSLKEFLVYFEIGFFDISIVCLPLSSEIRKKWNTEDDFKIGNKQISVILFEIGLEHFLNGIEFQIEEHPLFAIGMPVNTSAGIFEYYSQKLFKVYKDPTKDDLYFDSGKKDELKISIDLGVTNTTSTFIKRNAKGTTFPLFKSNIVNSGYPNTDLMKNAFNLD